MPHYFDDQPDVASMPETVDVSLDDVSFSYQSDRGVFSHGRLDTGTRLLLRSVPPPPTSGNLLDLGCGAGPIAIALAMRSPAATVWAADPNQRALALTERNASAAGCTNVRPALPDDVPADLSFDCIWSNPPIRIGKAALHDLLERWLSRLADGGSACLVVQKHLGSDSLQRWLTDAGFPTTRAASKAGYRILSVTPRNA